MNFYYFYLFKYILTVKECYADNSICFTITIKYIIYNVNEEVKESKLQHYEVHPTKLSNNYISHCSKQVRIFDENINVNMISNFRTLNNYLLFLPKKKKTIYYDPKQAVITEPLFPAPSSR